MRKIIFNEQYSETIHINEVNTNLPIGFTFGVSPLKGFIICHEGKFIGCLKHNQSIDWCSPQDTIEGVLLNGKVVINGAYVFRDSKELFEWLSR